MSEFKATVDARQYPPRDKHRVILSTYESLETGEAMELINDHEPRPLFYQFQAEYTDQFDWEYLEQGPDLWRVKISKR